MTGTGFGTFEGRIVDLTFDDDFWGAALVFFFIPSPT